MIRVTYKISGEYTDYSSIELTEKEYDTVSKFINNLNADSSNIQIEEVKKESI